MVTNCNQFRFGSLLLDLLEILLSFGFDLPYFALLAFGLLKLIHVGLETSFLSSGFHHKDLDHFAQYNSN